MPQAPFTVFALSDATAELAHNLTLAAVNQFPENDCHIIRVPKITDLSQIDETLERALEKSGILVFTFVSEEMREFVRKRSQEVGVQAVDALGPTLDALASYMHTPPSKQPGLQYKMTRHYFKRTEAVEFTVKHDDGLGLESVAECDLLLLGISRTSKTPLSIYLAYHGYRCANIPIVKQVPLPKIIKEMDPKKIVGLTIDARKLATIRGTRLRKLGRPSSESYGSPEHIKDEIDYAIGIFREIGAPVIDVTGKAIEETASEIIQILELA
ncbi:MAG: kinase/pyrophosphorylase [Deltaproteobacteria bacterium]|nr:kinase/pyrophosphorylase [Deltaproteobacteria bacterium]